MPVENEGTTEDNDFYVVPQCCLLKTTLQRDTGIGAQNVCFVILKKQLTTCLFHAHLLVSFGE
jgi:hypothetical protein